MAIDEYLFGKAIRFFKKTTQDSDVLARRIVLDDIQARLTVMARALTGEAIEIVPATEEGGCKGLHFFLPSEFALFPDQASNRQWYIFRIVYMVHQRRLRLNWNEKGDYSLLESRRHAIETAPQVLDQLQSEFPVVAEIHQSLLQQILQMETASSKNLLHWLYGKWMVDETLPDFQEEMDGTGDPKKKNEADKAETTLKTKAVEELELLKVDKKSQEDYVMTHNFEKVETAEEYDGVWRDFDGSDQLEEHQEALDELQMKYIVRADDPTHSVYQSDFAENISVAESADNKPGGFFIPYDEWDYKKGKYKPDFCKLFPESPVQVNPDYYRNVVLENRQTLVALRKMLANVNNKRKQTRLQTQGEEFDIDLVTDMFIDLYNKHTPNEKIYLSSKKAEKDISILLLLDSSLSTDSYAAGNRVIDVEKQVSILFGEILNEYGIDFSIAGFSSHTRNQSRFLMLKDFDETWVRGRNRVGALEPQGYTRIGVSVRHAGTLLKNRPTKNKWLIFVSDGKPNDYDRYEGRYGIQDVKQALRELAASDIHTFALAIEAQARYYLPQMFGQNHYQILTSPNELLRALVKLYTKIKSL
ncbi:MAG: VWA domain-containing protein [Bacteroidales bacterium]|nr:VWA domain-containing protein [Bacteroidales bacterium]